MDTPNVTALSSLKVGDIFQLAQLRDTNTPEGEAVQRWKVVSIGAAFCGATLEGKPGEESEQADASPKMFASRTSVLHFPQTTNLIF